MSDTISDLHRVVYEIFSSVSWRMCRVPPTSEDEKKEDIEYKMRDILGRLRIEENYYKDTIRKQDEMIKSLATKLDNYIKFGSIEI